MVTIAFVEPHMYNLGVQDASGGLALTPPLASMMTKGCLTRSCTHKIIACRTSKIEESSEKCFSSREYNMNHLRPLYKVDSNSMYLGWSGDFCILTTSQVMSMLLDHT